MPTLGSTISLKTKRLAMSFQGIEFTPEMRKMVVNLKLFFDEAKRARDDLKRPATKLTSSALNISESTVKVIMAAYSNSRSPFKKATTIKTSLSLS